MVESRRAKANETGEQREDEERKEEDEKIEGEGEMRMGACNERNQAEEELKEEE